MLAELAGWLLPFMPARLEPWEARDFHPRSLGPPPPEAFHDHHRRIVAVEAPGLPEPDGPFIRVARAIREYRIFPPRIGEPVTRRPVELGDTVGLRYHFLPGLDLFFASRVVELFRVPNRSGFTYRTLQGHPEAGEETFSVTKGERGEIVAELKAWSRPAWPLLELGLPLARRFQLAAGKAALDHLEAIAQVTRPSA